MLFPASALADTKDKITPVVKRNGLSIPLVFGGGSAFSKTVNIEDNDVELAGSGGLFFGTGLYYALANNLKFGGIVQYQTNEVKQTDLKGSTSFKRYIITPELKVPIKLDSDSFINVGGGYSFYFKSTLDFNDAGSDKLSGQTSYENENGIHFVTEYEEKVSAGAFSIGVRYYNVQYSFKGGDFSLNNLDGMGVDLYISFSVRL